MLTRSVPAYIAELYVHPGEGVGYTEASLSNINVLMTAAPLTLYMQLQGTDTVNL
jgi:hypothetical protein